MKKTWIKSISLSLACLLGFGVLAATLAVNNKQSNPVKVDAATTTTATLTYTDVLANARGDYKKTTWGNWEWWRVTKSSGELYAGHNTYFVNNKAYSDGATRIDFSISFKDGYVIPRIEMIAETLATNSNSFSWTITDTYYNENPPKRIYFEDNTSGETHIIESLTITYTFTKYKVSLNSNGGTGGLSSVQLPYNRAMPTISSSNLPTKDGYAFQGYYDTSASTGGNQYYKANGTSARKFTNKNDSLVLYARWALSEKPVNITKGTGLSNVYVSSNGNVTDASSSDLKASGTNFAIGSTVYGYVKLSKGYKAQNGWTLKTGTADTEGALYLVGSGAVSSSGYDFGTLNASTLTYSIDYELNGGSVATANPTSYTLNTNTFTLNNPTKDGYTFTGWSGTDLVGNTNMSVTVTKGSIGNRTYTANWSANTYEITFDKQNGTGGTDKVTATFGSDMPTATMPTRVGYDFKGYYDSTTGGTQYYTSSGASARTWNIANDTILYARWGFNSIVQNAVDKINAIGEVDYPSSKASIIEAEIVYEALAEEYKAVVVAEGYYAVLTDARTEYETQKEQAINGVIQAIDAIGEVVYPTSSTAIENARALYNALDEEEKNLDTIPNYGVLVADEEVYAHVDNCYIKINEIGEVALTEASKAKIDLARETYDALTDEEKELVINLEILEHAEEVYGNAKEAYDAIEAIGELEVSEACEEKITNARDLFDALTNEEKTIVTNIGVLEHDEVTYHNAKAVVDEIIAIGELNVSEECIAKINHAKESYDALTEEEQALVYNYPNLLHNEVVYYNGKYVYDLIDNLSDIEYNEVFKADLDFVKGAYDALTDEEKAIVANSDELLHKVEVYNNVDYVVNLIKELDTTDVPEDYGQKLQAAREAYEALTDEEKNFVCNIQDLDRYEQEFSHVKAVHDEIQNLELDVSDEFLEELNQVKEHYNALSEEEKELVTNRDRLAQLEEEYNHAKAVVDEINALGNPEVTEAFENKLASVQEHYNALNNEEKSAVYNYNVFTHKNEVYNHAEAVMNLIDAIAPVDLSEECQARIKQARDAYNALTSEEKAIVANYNKLLDIENTVDEVTEVVNLINNIGEVEVSEASKDKIDAAKAAYNALSEEEKALVSNYETLTHAEKVYEDAREVIDLINDVDPVLVDEASKERIDEARDAYDALTNEEKALVFNYEELVEAESIYDNAKEVVDLIDAIGEVEYTDESKAKIDAAREAYEALSDEEKLIVSNYTTLVSDETEYDHVDETVKLINEIGNIELNDESKAKIDEAKKAYDALTEEEKALIPQTSSSALDHAVEQYQSLEKGHIRTIILCISGCFFFLIFLILLILYLRAKYKKYMEEK